MPGEGTIEQPMPPTETGGAMPEHELAIHHLEQEAAEEHALTLTGGGLDFHLSVKRIEAIRTFIANALKRGIDFASIRSLARGHDAEGAPEKETLLLPGAEKVALYLGLRPRPTVQVKAYPDGHILVVVYCELVDRQRGNVIGYGQGACSTRESKYAYRYLPARKKPEDDFEIQRAKVLGLGRFRNFGTKQKPNWQWCERVANPNIADEHHTVRLIADKRAFVHAVRKTAALSEAFTQDLEDYVDAEIVAEMKHPPKQPQRTSQSKQPAERPKQQEHRQEAKADFKMQPEKVMGSVVGVIENVTLPTQPNKPAWVKIKDSDIPLETNDRNQFENLKSLKGRSVSFDFTEETTPDGKRRYRTITEFWIAQD